MDEQAPLRFKDQRRRRQVEDIRQDLERRMFSDLGSQYLHQAARNNLQAVESLSCRFDGRHVGLFVKWVYLMGLSTDCLQAALGTAWECHHGSVIEAARTRAELVRWFRAAQFDTSMLPDELTVWRGTSGLPWVEALYGWSWTTSRSVAAWFAMRHAQHLGSPLVLRRTVKRQDILYFSDRRNEAECVLADIGPFDVDGTEEDWRRLKDEEVLRRRLTSAAAAAAAA